MSRDNAVMWLHHSTTDISGSASTYNILYYRWLFPTEQMTVFLEKLIFSYSRNSLLSWILKLHHCAHKSPSAHAMPQMVCCQPLTRGPSSRPGQSMWNLWWTRWQWERPLSEYFGFIMSLSFHQCYTLILHPPTTDGM
jgi:hypothetical protein